MTVLWRENRAPQAGPCVRVDMNRNWDSHWAEDGSSHDPCSLLYHGTAPFSEQETREIWAHRRVIRAYLDVHSYSQVWIAPWEYSQNRPPGDAAAQAGIKYSYIVELRDTGRYAFLLPPDQILSTAEEIFPSLLAVGDRTRTRSLVTDALAKSRTRTRSLVTDALATSRTRTRSLETDALATSRTRTKSRTRTRSLETDALTTSRTRTRSLVTDALTTSRNRTRSLVTDRRPREEPNPNSFARDRRPREEPNPNSFAQDRRPHDEPNPNSFARDRRPHDEPNPNYFARNELNVGSRPRDWTNPDQRSWCPRDRPSPYRVPEGEQRQDWRSHNLDWLPRDQRASNWNRHNADWRAYDADCRRYNADWHTYEADWHTYEADWRSQSRDWRMQRQLEEFPDWRYNFRGW
ncbi:metallocarboxypeptidase [Branchiostoma belcheri]|nr:metallocarboxypeptidase [Branchiostoma belcheri]KAI8482807.1 metallocarboxypeptidase [Branchiostoma belcheri]